MQCFSVFRSKVILILQQSISVDGERTKGNGQITNCSSYAFTNSNALETNQYAQAILDITILAEYISYLNEMLQCTEHTLYRLEKTKIVFKYHWLINSKLCRLSFNYPKFHISNHFTYCIWDYSSAINNDIVHSKVTYKYLLKVFYNKTKKKEYNMQIRQYNIRYTNIIAMKDLIILKKF